MANTPMTIINRPFSIEPLTGIMLPDGIFDTAIFQQKITCFYTNFSNSELENVNIYFEGIGDPNIIITPNSYHYASIPAGASVQISWLGNFQNASIGKKNVSIIAKADGHNLKREIKQIFVTKTTYDSTTNKYTCQVPEGNMVVDIQSAIVSKEECKEKGRLPALWLPVKMNMQVAPNPPYNGQFGDIPFQDPWWKIVAIIVAVLAAIGAAIAAALGSGKAAVGVSGGFDEVSGEVDCCTPSDGLSIEERLTVAGALSTVASGAIIVALSDAKDSWYRGQENTVPSENEVTLRETVEMEIGYIESPQAGAPYTVEVKWNYHRITNLNHYTYSVSEVQKNIHTLGNLEVFAPATLKLGTDPFVFSAKFAKEDDSLFKGIDLFAFALVVSPSSVAFRVPLLDDGIDYDKKANDGLFTGHLDWEIIIREHYRKFKGKEKKIDDLLIGYWKIYIYAQDINDASPDMKPTEAATHIGGMMIASATKIKFDSSLPCPLTADASINVIP